MGKYILLDDKRIMQFGKTQIRSAKKIKISRNADPAKIQYVNGDIKIFV